MVFKKKKVGINNDPCPAGQPISSLPLAEIPAFQELCSCTISSRFHRGNSQSLPRRSSLNLVFGALATPAISVVRVTISSIPVAPFDRFVITNSERGRGGGGMGCGWVMDG